MILFEVDICSEEFTHSSDVLDKVVKDWVLSILSKQAQQVDTKILLSTCNVSNKSACFSITRKCIWDSERVQGKRVILHSVHMSSSICKTETRCKNTGCFTEDKKNTSNSSNYGKRKSIYNTIKKCLPTRRNLKLDTVSSWSCTSHKHLSKKNMDTHILSINSAYLVSFLLLTKCYSFILG